MPGRKLRKGYTTGTCAAAGAKAAALLLLGGLRPGHVDVALPRGGTLRVPVKSIAGGKGFARAVIVKDAGDDPDVTDKAEFVAEVELLGENARRASVRVRGGKGVGVVTKPGLKVRPGKPAINPVPLSMIRKAVKEAAALYHKKASFLVTISVPLGAELAARTMNPRLGIVGGISILGTTGIVEPMSLAAYTHSISCGVGVAVASGLQEVVFSTGRSSEKAVEKRLKVPEAACVLTGDHMGYALKDAATRPEIKKVVVAGQFGKFTKLAAGRFETHCDDAPIELDFLAGLCERLGAGKALAGRIREANTARHAFFMLKGSGFEKALDEVSILVKRNAERMLGKGKSVTAVLVGYDGDIASIR